MKNLMLLHDFFHPVTSPSLIFLQAMRHYLAMP